jgi:hypothetical protein
MQATCKRCGEVIDTRQMKKHQEGRLCHIGAMCRRASREGFRPVKSAWILPMRKVLDERFCRRVPYRLWQGSIVYTYWFKSPRLEFRIDDLMDVALQMSRSKRIRIYKAFAEVLTLTDREA